MPKERGYELAEKVDLAFGAQPKRSQVSWLKAPCQETMNCPCHLEVGVGERVGAVRKLRGNEDSFLDHLAELVPAQPRGTGDLRNVQRNS